MELKIDFGFNPAPKPGKSVRIKPTQRMMGDISDKVDKQLKNRSGGVCELRITCTGSFAVQRAHITGRGHLTRKTTVDDLLHVCLACHQWMDQNPDGIKYKRKLAMGLS